MREVKYWKKNLKNRPRKELETRLAELNVILEEQSQNIDALHEWGRETICYMRYGHYPKEVTEELNEWSAYRKELRDEYQDIWCFLNGL